MNDNNLSAFKAGRHSFLGKLVGVFLILFIDPQLENGEPAFLAGIQRNLTIICKLVEVIIPIFLL